MKKFIKKAVLMFAFVFGLGFAAPQTVSANVPNFEQGHLKEVFCKFQIGDTTYTLAETREGKLMLYASDANGNKIGETVLN